MMFHLIGTYIPTLLKTCQSVHWHFSESGHGKGAPDGIGATLKRTPDRLVALGNDMSDFKSLCQVLQKEVTNIEFLVVEANKILETDKVIPDKATIPPFKGTLMVHEVVWNKGCQELYLRRLTCLECKELCKHYGLGTKKLNSILFLHFYYLNQCN